MQTKTCKKPEIDRDVISLFSEAILQKDIKTIQSLLAEDGTFDIQSPRLNTLEVNKKRFISWFKKRLKQNESIEISFDTCLFCSIGATVLLINGGKFPRQIKDSSERSKTGLMLEVNNGLITRFKFCYVLTKTENKYVIEEKMERIRHYTDKGLSFWYAMQLVETELFGQKDEP
jgi:hypothetical protein